MDKLLNFHLEQKTEWRLVIFPSSLLCLTISFNKTKYKTIANDTGKNALVRICKNALDCQYLTQSLVDGVRERVHVIKHWILADTHSVSTIQQYNSAYKNRLQLPIQSSTGDHKTKHSELRECLSISHWLFCTCSDLSLLPTKQLHNSTSLPAK